ncbi:MAG: hypothetical protein MUC64_18655 [Rubritepida sp.]|jgi:chromosome segregation ATPase|nr:hypothetical protein [Rubritepida sp.]
MPEIATVSRSLAAGLLGLGLATAAPAGAQTGSPTDYDGAWQFVLSCSANSSTRAPAFTERFPVTIERGEFTRIRTVRAAEGPDIVDRWRGAVANGRLTVAVESVRGPQRWATRLEGAATSPTRFELTGGVFLADNRQVRQCTMTGALQRPAAGSLAAAGPARAQAERQREAAAAVQRLASVETALAAALAATAQAEERGAALQTELDLARFEGNAMRAEIDRRGAALQAAAQAVAQAQQQITALTARAGQAESGLAATQRDLAAARGEATQISTRAAQLEAALQALRGEATQTSARAAQLEAALQAARGEATQATARAGQLEAAGNALRAELEQLRRTLAEREAAAPRQ